MKKEDKHLFLVDPTGGQKIVEELCLILTKGLW
jgi:hypothetical protein